jgi:hypothetical protein
MQFFRSLYNSLFNVEWLRSRFLFVGSAWAYFFLLSLFLCIFSLIPIAVGVPGALREVRTAIETKVPDFQAEVTDGELTVTGVANPFTVTTDQDGKTFTFYMDTVATSTYDVAELLQSPDGGVVLVTRDAVEVYDASQGRDQKFLWKSMGDLKFNKQFILDRFDRYTVPALLIIIGFFLLVGTYIGFVVAKLVSILLVSFIVFVVCRIAGPGWRFGQLFTIGLYAFTLPSLIALVLWLVNIPITSIHFLSLLAFMLAIVFTRDRVASEPVAAVEVEKELDKKMDLDLEK